MAELTELWRAILDAVRRGPCAWCTPLEVADTLGWDVEQACDEMASMDVAGWLDVWEQDDGPVVTLSALAAEVLRVRLDEFGREGTPRWIDMSEPEPSPPRARNVCLGDKGANFDFLVDPHPTPDQACELAEQCEHAGSDPENYFPRPRLLLGFGLTPWPGPSPEPESPCPACGSVALAPHAYCIRCDAWGHDAALKPGNPAAQPRPSSALKTQSTRERDARRRTERARRKQRRRSRLAARVAG